MKPIPYGWFSGRKPSARWLYRLFFQQLLFCFIFLSDVTTHTFHTSRFYANLTALTLTTEKHFVSVYIIYDEMLSCHRCALSCVCWWMDALLFRQRMIYAIRQCEHSIYVYLQCVRYACIHKMYKPSHVKESQSNQPPAHITHQQQLSELFHFSKHQMGSTIYYSVIICEHNRRCWQQRVVQHVWPRHVVQCT